MKNMNNLKQLYKDLIQLKYKSVLGDSEQEMLVLKEMLKKQPDDDEIKKEYYLFCQI